MKKDLTPIPAVLVWLIEQHMTGTEMTDAEKINALIAALDRAQSVLHLFTDVDATETAEIMAMAKREIKDIETVFAKIAKESR